MVTRIDKALVAGFGAAVAAAGTAQASGQDLEKVAIIAVGSFIVVGFLTFLVPNKPAAA